MKSSTKTDQRGARAFKLSENIVLNDFAKEKYIKCAKVAGKKVYFDLNSKIRRYLIEVLKHRG